MFRPTLVSRIAVRDSKVAIVGGSIAGCAAATALRSVARPTVFERSSKDLRDRGLGIGLPSPIQQALLQGGFVTDKLRWNQAETRHWVVRDDENNFTGRKVWESPFPIQLHNWGLLWNELRSLVSDELYHGKTAVSSVVIRQDGVELFTKKQRVDDEETSLGTFDVVLAADGAGSFLRDMVVPDSAPNYSGYVLWRGSIPLEHFSNPQFKQVFVDQRAFTTFGYKDGHGLAYCIPSSQDPEKYLVNFGMYTHTPPGTTITSPEVVRDVPLESLEWFENKVVHTKFPPMYQEMFQATKTEISVHPVCDESPEMLVHDSGRIILIGDAGAILRPHTASGTAKAIQDVFALRDLCTKEGATWESVAQEYQSQRKVDADNMVALGQRLGEAQVLQTPDWGEMSAEDYEAWIKAQVSGKDHYMYRKLRKD